MIIAGGREYQLSTLDYLYLDNLPKPDVVICGGATGADTCGAAWATERGIPVEYFLPEWGTHGRAAGHIRNYDMAQTATAVVLFPGGPGTKSMCAHAKKAGLTIYDKRRK
jgi:predicted Rossmann-fold nucleotide-binding protein